MFEKGINSDEKRQIMTLKIEAKTIALVEDEPDLRENYRLALTNCGYTVDCYENREQAERAFDHELPDLLIVDVGLGTEYEGGFELCRIVRAKSALTPIIFLTARDSELDIISGLRLGADDYLTKDISLGHLLARVNALLRRVDAIRQESQNKDDKQKILDLHIDSERLYVKWKKQNVALTVTEFWLVHCLARYPGQVKSRQQLMDAANLVLDDQTITAHIKRIRKKFIAIDTDFSAIESVYAAGYRWLDSVR